MSIQGRKNAVEVLSERSRMQAAAGNSSKIVIRYAEDPGPSVSFRLTRGGSFSPDEVVKQAVFPVERGEVNLFVYAPRRPGTSFLMGPGVKHRLDFLASSFLQGLVYEWAPTLGMAFLLALVLRTYAVASFFIPSSSMESTLMPRDLLIADKLSFKVLHKEPSRGDVIIFRFPLNQKQDYIKRLIGLPGDVVEVKDRQVYVNGTAIEEAYIKEQPNLDYPRTVVPEDQYFMMGDNRNKSSDSRVWGFVPRDNLEGRALFVFWPPGRAKVIENGLQDATIPAPDPSVMPDTPKKIY
jgi:signal peptidase I